MSDKAKTILAIIFFLAALTLPLIGLAVGWWRWEFKTGFLIMVITFVVFFLAGVISIWRVRDLSWLATSLPFLFGGLYTILPDVVPFQVDDAAATTAGALLSYGLALRKSDNTPKWVILPLLAAAVYAFFGGTFPGPLDEIIVDVVALLIASIGARRSSALDEGNPPIDDESLTPPN
jgi:hypothetical protein